jgi:DNA polymerase III epsilon subunit-like protein
VIEYACAVIENGKVVSEYEQLIAADEKDIPPHVQVMTHIHPEDLVDEPTFVEVVETIRAMLKPGMIVVGQNVKYDISMLRGEGWDMSDAPSLDTAMLASVVFPELRSYSLSYVSQALGLPHTPKHRALGDVRATVALLSQCWERLLMLPAADRKTFSGLARRGPPGLQALVAALEKATSPKGNARPSWVKFTRTAEKSPFGESFSIAAPPPASVGLLAEPLQPSFLCSALRSVPSGTWIAVKNIDACVRRIAIMPDTVTILSSPDFLLSEDAKKSFMAQAAFTGDELTLAMKLVLYEPRTKADIPIHGEEYQIWTGKLACCRQSPEYQSLLEKASGKAVMLTHHELLGLLSTGEFPKNMRHVVIDDASMLEDTATHALGWLCSIPVIRAASQGNPLLTQVVDLVELWVEKIRANLDLKYFTSVDLETKEAAQLRRLLTDLSPSLSELSGAAAQAFAHLILILQTKHLDGRIAWMETGMDGSKSLRSVPADIASLLEKSLYSRVPTTLCVPPGNQEQFRAFLPQSIASAAVAAPAFPPPASLSTPVGVRIDDVLTSPQGKTVLLVSSKHTIEDVYVQHAEEAESAGVTLLCQGFSGGQSRMQAEFALAKAPAVIVMTPWMFETIELPPASVDRLVVQTLPFDHPNHPVVSKRSERYRSAFGEYALPRLKHRLFRLLRTFLRHAKDGAIVSVLDERLRTKPYGKEVHVYLQALLPAEPPKTVQKVGQMSLL